MTGEQKMNRYISLILLAALLAGCSSQSNYNHAAGKTSQHNSAAKIPPTSAVKAAPATTAPANAGPRIALTNFDGGSTYFGGSKQVIMWRATGDTKPGDTVELWVSGNSGNQWSIIGSTAASKGQVIWNMPSTEGIHYRIKARLMRAAEQLAQWTSPADFSITCGLPRITPIIETRTTAPGTPLAAAGSITWKHELIISYTIALTGAPNEKKLTRENIARAVLWVTADSGATWEALGEFPAGKKGIIYTAADGRYGFYCAYLTKAGAWTASPTAGAAPQQTIIIDSTPPRGSIIYPSDGDQVYASDDKTAHVPILWDAADENLGKHQASILVVQGDGKWHTLGLADATAGIYETTLAVSPTPYKIKVVLTDAAGNETVLAQKQGFTVITQPVPHLSLRPTLSLVRPTGGEVLRGGSKQAILWKSTDFAPGTAKLLLEFYDGNNWQTLQRLTEPSGAYVWQVPKISSRNCRVRISADLGGNPLTAQSNKFAVTNSTPAPDIIIGTLPAEPPPPQTIAAPEETGPAPKHGAAIDTGTLINVTIKIPIVENTTPPAAQHTAEPSTQPTPPAKFTTEDLDKANKALEKENKITQAMQYVNEQKWVLAENALKTLIALYPNDPQVFYAYARYYYEQGRLQDAEQYFLKTVSADPKNASAHYYLGKIALRSNAAGITDNAVRFANAEARFKKAIECNPELAEAHNDLATLYFANKMYSEALDHFKKAADADTSNKIYLYNYGRTAFELGKYKIAIEHCQKAVAIDPAFPQPYWFIAKSYTAQHDWKQAATWWQKVVDHFGFDKRLQAQAIIELKKAQDNQ